MRQIPDSSFGRAAVALAVGALVVTAGAGGEAVAAAPAASAPLPECSGPPALRFVQVPEQLMSGRKFERVRLRRLAGARRMRIRGTFVARQGSRVLDQVWIDGAELHWPSLFPYGDAPVTLDARFTLRPRADGSRADEPACRLRLLRTIPLFHGKRPSALSIEAVSGTSVRFSLATRVWWRCQAVRAPGPLVLRVRREVAFPSYPTSRWIDFYAFDRCSGWSPQVDSRRRGLTAHFDVPDLRLEVAPPTDVAPGRTATRQFSFRLYNGEWHRRYGQLRRGRLLRVGTIVTRTRSTVARAGVPSSSTTSMTVR